MVDTPSFPSVTYELYIYVKTPFKTFGPPKAILWRKYDSDINLNKDLADLHAGVSYCVNKCTTIIDVKAPKS